MKGLSLASRLGSLVCPICEVGYLYLSGHDSASCRSCGGFLDGKMLVALRRITALPNALGGHACDCGHPEMRLLPDGTFHCPACGSEILPINAPSTLSKPDEHTEAYWAGWVTGRFGEMGSFVDNPSLARWEDPSDRLDYYRVHGAGSDARRASNSQNPDAREKLFG